jgi:signal transduction histidine kinase
MARNGRRTIPILLAAATLIPILALGWLGVRVLDQDSALERQRRRERLELAAGRLALAIERRLGDFEEQIAQGSGVRMSAGGIELGAPAGEVTAGPLYQPVVSTSEGALESEIGAVEKLEFAQSNLTGAAAAYRQLADSKRPELQAAALVRLGRVLRKSGDRAGALDAYHQLLKLGPVAIAGQPAELVVRQARCRIFEEAHDSEALRKEVPELVRALYSGVFRLDRSTFELYRDMAVRWGGPPPPPDRMARTEAAIALWREWRAGGLAPRGRRILKAGDTPVLALWAGGPARVTAWLATARELEASLSPLSKQQQLTLWLQDTEGQPFLGSRAPGGVSLNPTETRLPFLLGVAPMAATGGEDGYRTGRVIVISGLLLTFAFILAAAYGLYRATTRERDLARQQADFVSAVSHEFRTPLTSMRHLTEMLVSRGVPNEERREYYYQLLAGETERLHRMVESLLSFGHIEAGAYAWRLEKVEPRELVYGIVAEFRNDPLNRGREALCEIEADLPPIQADREALSRAIWNLLENAAKYSETATPIRVFVRRAAESILVGVEDHGSGIPPGEQSAIFQKFVRGAAAKRDGVRGVGIGLALVKRIVEAHGGSVQLASEPGHGSTFTLVLPCHAS